MTIELDKDDFDREGWPGVKMIKGMRLTEWKGRHKTTAVRVSTIIDVMRRPVYDAVWNGKHYLIDAVTGQLYDDTGKCLSSDQLKVA